MQPLTKRQADVLAYLRDFIDAHGYAPSLEELGKGLGLSSLATSHKHLSNLARKGYIVRQWNRSRQITLVEPGPTREQQLMQAFAAGFHAGETGQAAGEAWEAFSRGTDQAEEFSTTAKIVAKDA